MRESIKEKGLGIFQRIERKSILSLKIINDTKILMEIVQDLPDPTHLPSSIKGSLKCLLRVFEF